MHDVIRFRIRLYTWPFTYVSWIQESSAPKVKAKKKNKYVDYEVAPANGVFFLFDVETTGGKRNWDRIVVFIEIIQTLILMRVLMSCF